MSASIVLIDGNWTGHHPTYVKFFAETILERGYQVTVLCPQPDEVGRWILQKSGDAVDRFHVYEYVDRNYHPRLPGVCRALLRWRSAAQAVGGASAKGCPPGLVFFNYLDGYLANFLSARMVDIIFPYHWSGLYFSPERLRLPAGRLPRRDGPLLSDNCRSVALLDEGVAETLAAELKGTAVIPFPDFADLSPPDLEYQLPGQILEKAAGRRIIGLLGCIDKRKGTLTLLDVAERMKDESFFFVFAGVFCRQTFSSDELARLDMAVSASPDNCHFSQGFIPDEAAFNALVVTCDILFAAYNGFPHSSNLLTKAACFRKPIIVSDGFCMAERVRRYRLGQVITEGDSSGCIKAIRTLVAPAGPEVVRPDYDGYMGTHSKEQLKESLGLLLQRSF